jgi:CheY-like chemotaxis protein
VLIITDYNMPKKNGLEVLQIIKANKETKNIPVVMYSTSMPLILKTKLLNAGAFDCFSKPWNHDAFIGQVGKFGQLSSSFIINKNIA